MILASDSVKCARCPPFFFGHPFATPVNVMDAVGGVACDAVLVVVAWWMFGGVALVLFCLLGSGIELTDKKNKIVPHLVTSKWHCAVPQITTTESSMLTTANPGL